MTKQKISHNLPILHLGSLGTQWTIPHYWTKISLFFLHFLFIYFLFLLNNLCTHTNGTKNPPTSMYTNHKSITREAEVAESLINSTHPGGSCEEQSLCHQFVILAFSLNFKLWIFVTLKKKTSLIFVVGFFRLHVALFLKWILKHIQF